MLCCSYLTVRLFFSFSLIIPEYLYNIKGESTSYPEALQIPRESRQNITQLHKDQHIHPNRMAQTAECTFSDIFASLTGAMKLGT